MRDFRSVAGVLDQIVVSLGNFILAISLSKLLTPEDFGIYALIWLWVISFTSLLNAWFASPMFSIVPSLDSKKRNAFLIMLISQISLIATGVLAVIVLAVYFFNLTGSYPVFTLLISGISYFLYDFMRKVAITTGNLSELFAIDFLIYFGLLFSILGNFPGGIAEIGTILFSAYSIGFLCVLFSLFCKGQLNITARSIFFPTMHTLRARRLNFSKWMSYSSILQLVSGNGITILASMLLSLADLGLLRLAQTIAGIFNPILVYLENHGRVFFSRILHNSGESAMNAIFKNYALKFLFLSFLMIIVLILLADIFIGYAYPEFNDSPLRVYVIYSLLCTFLTLLSFVLRAKYLVLEETNLVFNSYLIAALVSALCVLPLVSIFGGQGVIFALGVSQIVMSVVLFKGMHSKINWKRKK